MITFKFMVAGEVVESCVRILAPEEWEVAPERQDPAWQAHFDPSGLVVANRLRVPTAILRPGEPELRSAP